MSSIQADIQAGRLQYTELPRVRQELPTEEDVVLTYAVPHALWVNRVYVTTNYYQSAVSVVELTLGGQVVQVDPAHRNLDVCKPGNGHLWDPYVLQEPVLLLRGTAARLCVRLRALGVDTRIILAFGLGGFAPPDCCKQLE